MHILGMALQYKSSSTIETSSRLYSISVLKKLLASIEVPEKIHL